MSVTAIAPAKINLALSVGPKRPDGFHEVATIYHALALYDEVTATASSGKSLAVDSDGVDVGGVPSDSSNLAWKAAELLAEHAEVRTGFDLHITKRIPVAGGLAGGSADAAATLIALDALWELGTPRDTLVELAAQLGSDVPFSIVGGTMIGSGRGEVLHPMPSTMIFPPPLLSFSWVVVPASGGLSTPTVYGEFDRLVPDPAPAHIQDGIRGALMRGNSADLAGQLANDLQAAALSLRPDLAETLRKGVDAGALRGIVSGSGPTTVFLCPDDDVAARVAAELGGIATRPSPHGAKVVE